jgi:ABC-2 type transport system ATP-binding protein
MVVMNGGNSGDMSDDSGRILVRRLRKQFGPVEAVRDLSFTVEPGTVTGFLGPNGAGKTTTLRIAVGLVHPDDGEVTINGVRYEQLAHPARVVGAVLDSQGFHRSRRARAHLLSYTAAIGVPDSRVDDVLTLVGLREAADRRVGGFSLGMRQRLALATALLGDPQVLILDEPGAGLDPEGVAWLRGFLRSFAGAGRTVLVSSHQLAEIEQTVDHVVIISQGTQVYEGSVDGVGGSGTRLRVQCADQATLAGALAARGVTDIQALPDGALAVSGASSTLVGEVALAAGVAIYGIAEQRADLERHFFELTSGQYQPSPAFGAVSPVSGAPLGSTATPSSASPPAAAPSPSSVTPQPPPVAEPIPPNPAEAPALPASTPIGDAETVPKSPQAAEAGADRAPARSAEPAPAAESASAATPADTDEQASAARGSGPSIPRTSATGTSSDTSIADGAAGGTAESPTEPTAKGDSETEPTTARAAGSAEPTAAPDGENPTGSAGPAVTGTDPDVEADTRAADGTADASEGEVT